jgi:hypothetical protein
VSCPDCAKAALAPHWVFTAGCRGCCARSIARLPGFAESRKAGVHSKRYQRELAEVGANVKPPVTHEEVKAAFAADAATHQPTTNSAAAQGATT